MSENASNHVININLSKQIRTSFLDYAMSVIVSRALPDVRDGLKPVHRRILHGMNELGVTAEKPYKKSARIVGDVMGKYHPHGDSAIYESMVRMAQDFSFRYMLVDGHGNFGSVDGDGAAAMRYTEARMSKITKEMLRDIKKNTVDFVENYDGTENEPQVLPARFPNLLVNGATGIAVGMTTNIPPHNLNEVIKAIKHLMDNEEATISDLMHFLPGPDFPTGGIVMGESGIKKAYETGRGTITIRSKANVEMTKRDQEIIVITELPYMVNKANLIKKIADLVRDKRLDGITDINDESDRDGLRVVIKVSRGASGSVILNNLYKLTSMQTSFGFNMLAIVDGTPKVLSLKDILINYLNHQEQVIRRRTKYDLDRAEERAHILAGLRIALDYIDEIISIIRGSKTPALAKDQLMNNYELSDKQAQAILDMRLVRLTGLEREKIEDEYNELISAITDYKDILSSEKLIKKIIYDELTEIEEKFGDNRRTELSEGDLVDLEDEDLIKEEEIMVVLTKNGYIKRMPTTHFKTQHRGGRGVKGMGVNDEDFIMHLLSVSTHDKLLLFTNKGKTYQMKGYEIPEYGRSAKGIPIINLLGIDKKESVQSVIKIDKNYNGKALFFATREGTVKRTSIDEFINIRSNGLKAINLKENDELINVLVTKDDDTVIIGTHRGYSAVFKSNKIRLIGRSTSGVRGITLRDEDYVVGLDILKTGSKVLVITENGYGKQTIDSEYPIKGRGGKGSKTANITEKNGYLIGLTVVDGDEDIMLVTDRGVLIRINVKNVSQTGRATLGVRLIKMNKGSKVATMSKIITPDDGNLNLL